MNKHSQFLLLTFFSLIFMLLSSCKGNTYTQPDPFYGIGSEWDHLRFPLIKPYYVIFISDEYGWQIPLQGAPSSRDFYYYLTIQHVQKISVEKDVIMIYSPYKNQIDESVGQKILYWFVFIPEKSIEMGFDNENNFLNYIQQFGVQNPSWRTPNEILEEYEKTSCLEWIPNCKP